MRSPQQDQPQVVGCSMTPVTRPERCGRSTSRSGTGSNHLRPRSSARHMPLASHAHKLDQGWPSPDRHPHSRPELTPSATSLSCCCEIHGLNLYSSAVHRRLQRCASMSSGSENRPPSRLSGSPASPINTVHRHPAATTATLPPQRSPTSPINTGTISCSGRQWADHQHAGRQLTPTASAALTTTLCQPAAHPMDHHPLPTKGPPPSHRRRPTTGDHDTAATKAKLLTQSSRRTRPAAASAGTLNQLTDKGLAEQQPLRRRQLPRTTLPATAAPLKSTIQPPALASR